MFNTASQSTLIYNTLIGIGLLECYCDCYQQPKISKFVRRCRCGGCQKRWNGYCIAAVSLWSCYVSIPFPAIYKT